MLGTRAVRRLAGRVTAPLLSQALTAGTSLLLQVVAARELGLAGYGAFALCIGFLASTTALYTAYIGDSVAVLDRHHPPTRAVLVTSALAALGLSFALGAAVVCLLGHGDLRTALVYAVMLVLWLVEDTFRRLFIARLEFWKLVGNDLTYLLGTVLGCCGLFLATGEVTLTLLFGAMTLGAAAAVLAGVIGVPRAERSRLRPGVAGMRAVVSFAGWRSLQGALRPTALLLSRTLVANLVTLTAVGVLEAGRLVVAPLQVVINGAGSFLLADFAAGERSGSAETRHLARRASVLLVAVTALGGAGMAVRAGPVGQLMTGTAVRPLLVLGWTAYLAAWAAGLPYVTEV
ncbi:MAG: hypothetical protein ACRDQ5_07355, partial [Sciscionella sp.]